MNLSLTKIKIAMKKNLNFILFVFMTVTVGWSQSSVLKVNTEGSSVHWKAKKVTGEHEGNVNLTEGSFEMEGSQITSGSFTVDMSSISCTDLSGEYKGKLEGHLKSDDFFSVEKFPTANLVITKSELKMKNHYLMEGDLTIKGITHPVNFEMHFEEDTAQTKLILDRSKYDIRFRSASFFENLGDTMIYDEFELDVNLKF
jgi:polyisoprenoid-binding protein YceI